MVDEITSTWNWTGLGIPGSAEHKHKEFGTRGIPKVGTRCMCHFHSFSDNGMIFQDTLPTHHLVEIGTERRRQLGLNDHCGGEENTHCQQHRGRRRSRDEGWDPHSSSSLVPCFSLERCKPKVGKQKRNCCEQQKHKQRYDGCPCLCCYAELKRSELN